jgi:hypothetical protein
MQACLARSGEGGSAPSWVSAVTAAAAGVVPLGAGDPPGLLPETAGPPPSSLPQAFARSIARMPLEPAAVDGISLAIIQRAMGADPMFDDSDAATLAQYREWKRAWEQANQSELSEAERAEACDVMIDMLVALAKIPAAGAAGLALKLAALFESRDGKFHLRQDPFLSEDHLWFSLITDAGRLIPELAPLAAEVAALRPEPVDGPPAIADPALRPPERDLEDARRFAPIAFEPVDNAAMLKDFSEPTYRQMMADIGVDLRLSAVNLGKTKPELVAVARNLLADRDGGEALFTMLDRLADTKKRLESLVQIVEAAYVRLHVAAAVVVLELERAATQDREG